jgi:hypothetical protein
MAPDLAAEIQSPKARRARDLKRLRELEKQYPEVKKLLDERERALKKKRRNNPHEKKPPREAGARGQ